MPSGRALTESAIRDICDNRYQILVILNAASGIILMDDMTVPWRREFTREELEKELEHDYSTSKSGIVPLGERRSLYHFVAIWVTVGVIVPVLVVVLDLALGASLSLVLALSAVALFAIGLYLPFFWLRRQASTRTSMIERTLPDAVDLIVTNAEAGLGLQAAMLSVATRFGGPISVEFSRVIRETSLGRPREEALEALGVRSGSRDMRLFVRAVIQSERVGIPIAEVLRGYAADIRRDRRQRAREKAGKIPVQVTLATVAFMFPTMFLLLLGPIILNALDIFSRR